MGLERPVMVNPYDYLPPVPSFAVTSADVVDGEQVALTFVHDSVGGENVSPQLEWSGFPESTQSFVVTCFDPDAPIPSGFWHWTVVDVPVSVTSFACAPPPGDHPHGYFFVVHAVDVPSLGVDASVSPAVVGFNLAFHTLARAVIAPTYRH
jgi:phosphatidylethanolamine-binding protein (PEBP) family uncharacterized protein